MTSEVETTGSGSPFAPHLIKLGLEAADRKKALSELSRLLEDSNKVRDSYLGAVLVREEEFPTGLPTPGAAIAIPHADPEHCLEPAVAVGITKSPVSFAEMGSPESELDVRIIFLISATESGDHLRWLSTLATVFQDPDFALRLLDSKDSCEAYRLLDEAFGFHKESDRA
ncbi:MAG: PTS sugar transporter subunit IIA [Rubrobacteraceae bacterium]|uniref:PTS sugar transporter subunit IIA n=1 Tax=Rubrobacter naiadicus TaxID=1392641 RepID=UPI00235DF141|nr:PTS sugar transporter subunit IIA [Rubrobacter naiadicus]MBX6764427.1 PTS sugar transporter subunit IIA [Rubrobacteraceae bacterium]MCL6438365.1 PTS sugar transporter subunit IIA [Rubrobacteraceae bacterium]